MGEKYNRGQMRWLATQVSKSKQWEYMGL